MAKEKASKASTAEEPTMNSRKWDASLVLAFIAVLISCLSALISWQEAHVMEQQQQVLISQQEASVWPYLENTAFVNYDGDTAVTFQYVVTNKGIGPAIIGEVDYSYDGASMEGWNLYKALENKYGDGIIVDQTQNSTLDNAVLAPGETHVVVTEDIRLGKETNLLLGPLVNEIIDLYKLKYCYCSVYGKCWQVKSINETKPSTDCEFREDIR